MIRNIIIAGIILLGFAYCKPKANQEEIQQVKDQEKFDETSAAIAEQFSGMISTASLSDVSAQLMSLGAEFDEAFINDPANAGMYKDSTKMAANLGIYYVDLIYAAANDKGDLAISLFSSSQSLANNLGIGRFFDQAILDRFKESMSAENEALLLSSLEDASTNLNTLNRPRVNAIVLAGVLLERLHIFGAIIDQSKDLDIDDESRSLLVLPAMKMAVGQMGNFNKVVEYINIVRIPSDPPYFRNLNSISNEFAKLVEVKDEIDRTEVVDPSVLSGLFSAVEEARAEVTAPSE